MGFTLIERWSPEYALNNAIKDVKAEGLDGLKKHLTSKALKSVNRADAISNMTSVSLVSTVVMGDDAVTVLLDKLNECDWTIQDIMKGSETTKAIVGFDYEGKLVGTLELTLIKEDKIWRIDSLSKPRFDEISLS